MACPHTSTTAGLAGSPPSQTPSLCRARRGGQQGRQAGRRAWFNSGPETTCVVGFTRDGPCASRPRSCPTARHSGGRPCLNRSSRTLAHATLSGRCRCERVAIGVGGSCNELPREPQATRRRCQLGGGYLRAVSSCSVSSWRVVIASNLATNPATLPLRMGGDRGRALQ